MKVTLLPYQYDSLQDTSSYLMWHGGRGSGKSRSLVMDLYNCCVSFPGGFFALTCNDYEQLKDSTHETLIRYLYDIGCPYKYNKNDKTLTLPNGSSIHELTLHKDKTSLKGPEWDGVFFDEADGKHTTQDKYDYLIDSCRGKIGDRRIRVACNPLTPGHFLAQRYALSPSKDHAFYRVTTYDNAANLPVDYIPRMEARHPPGTDDHKRWMLGELVSMEGAVYKQFNPDFIIDPDDVPDSADAIIYGQDLNMGGSDPWVLLEGRLSPNGMLYIVDEYYNKGGTYDTIKPDIKRFYKKGPIISDHSAHVHSLMMSEGYTMVKAQKDVAEGIQRVKDRIADGKIRITSNCKNLIHEMYNYCWSPVSVQGNEYPQHKYSHGPDSLRYLIMFIDKKNKFAL